MSTAPVAYLDTSALAKLIRAETETVELKRFLPAYPRVVSSALACTELRRVAHGLGASHVATAEHILGAITLAPASQTVLDRAGRLLPGSTLRSLDAIHLASALALPSLDVFVTYDARQAEAAAVLGLPTAAPA